MTEEPDDAPAPGSRVRRAIVSVLAVLRGILHSRHLYRPPEE